jgi:hypothetical protein
MPQRHVTLALLHTVILLGAGKISAAQAPESGPPVHEPRPAIKLLRFEEDWSALQDKRMRTDLLDTIKYIPLPSTDGRNYLSIGGEFRGVYERIQNNNWTPTPYATNYFGLERLQLHADLHAAPHLRLFIQLESGEVQGELGGPRPIDKKDLDFLNAFLDIYGGSAARRTTLRVGRQEFNFGSGRLVAVREGPNVRQGFYGVRLNQRLNQWTLDAFAVHPAADEPGFFDNVPLHTTSFWGAFAERQTTGVSAHLFDAYYFGLERKSATFNQGTAQEQRETIGTRFATVDLQPSDLQREDQRALIPHFDVEAAYQFGTFGQGSIEAWTVATEAGYMMPRIFGKPRAGFRADISSGDKDPNKHNLQTFNPLFPIGNYFGVLSDTGPGPVNFVDVHPEIKTTMPHGFNVGLDWVIWWRQSLHDGIYGVPGNLLVPASQSDARFAGHRPGMEIRWQRDAHFYLQADYGVFFAGPFQRESGRPHNLNYTSFWTGYKF